MAACRMPNYKRTGAHSLPKDRQEGAELSDYVQNGNARAERVRGNGDGQAVRVQSFRKERVERPVAPLPVAAMHVCDERRIAIREKQVIAMPVARAIAEVKFGVRSLAIGGRRN